MKLIACSVVYGNIKIKISLPSKKQKQKQTSTQLNVMVWWMGKCRKRKLSGLPEIECHTTKSTLA